MSQPTIPSETDRAEFEAARDAVLSIGRESERIRVFETMTRLVDEADDLGAEGAKEILKIAQNLQDRRAFALLLFLCLLASRSGLSTPALKQKAVQALIELKRLREAIREAHQLADATYADPEDPDQDPGKLKVWKAAMGNIGRAHKQAYLNAALAEDRTPDPVDLREAAEAYLEVWNREHGASTTYHAINAAALVSRAARDRETGLTGAEWARDEDARALANEILDIHREDLKNALLEGTASEDIWTLATCGEAFLVMRMMDDAAECYGKYAAHPDISAFNLASSLRQLQEVWGFSGEDRTDGGAIVRLLKAALINLDATAALEEETPANSIQTESVMLSVKEARLIESDLSNAQASETKGPAGFEAYFGKRGSRQTAGTMVDIERLAGAMRRSRALCAIETVTHGGWQRIGTGFVVEGDVLHPDWAGETYIVSNHHVTSGGDASLSSSFQRCRAVFVDLDPLDDTEASYTVEFAGVIWESNEANHDVAVLLPATDLPSQAAALSARDVSEYLPKRRDVDRDGTDMHVVILGFPGGGKLSYSFGDEMLLDHDACEPGKAVRPPLELDGRPIHLHYRTPSLPGSSGSPVFEAGSWKLVGVHHKGLPECPRLSPKTATYEANEGIWLPSIRAAIAAAQGPDPEFFQMASAARKAAIAAGGAGAMTDLAKQVFAKPIGGAPPAASSIAEARQGLPGHYIAYKEDEAGVQDLYLRTGLFEGDMDTFRASARGFETVIGDDNRMQVQHTTADPFRMICSLVIRQAGGFTNYGTGFLIGRRTLITAGHCLLGYPGAPKVEAVEIRPARSGINEPFSERFGEILGQRFSVHPAWSERFDPLFDIGAIHLGQDIGDVLGWFRVGALEPAALTHRWAHVTGYPGDKLSAPGLRAPMRAAEMWHHATPIDAVNARQVFYPADTYAGQSGAPVYILDKDGRARVVAVHAYGLGSGGAAYSEDNNSGVLLDASMLQVLADWRTVQ
ncbi:MAG: trypsin-like peptidase domain-containing protein [Hyphomonadaceae bacterium]|nr:trypsin-like peptidase domain-containing protein [Hyphomonadaceae bacterium]